MKAFGLTDKGKKRDKNQDSIQLDNDLGLYIVADGMGGHMHGEVASRMAVTSITDFLRDALPNKLGSSDKADALIKELLRTAVMKANNEILNYSRDVSEKNIMGTTVSLALFRNRRLYLAHIGDSRIYRLRKGILEKLTKDHTKAQELVDAHLLPAEEADNHSSSHILTRALGVTDMVALDIDIYDIHNGDSFLLSSDGLFRVLDAGAVKDVFMGGFSIVDKCRALIDKTLDGGAPDNVSVIIVEPEKKGFLGRIFL